MRRAERLFQIIQILRRAGGPVTAEQMAAELETSRRSVYRDIAALVGQRVPIRGEAGIGYVLEDGFDLPPLTLTAEEIEAAVLGAQWVAGHSEPALARAAQDLITKIEATIVPELKAAVGDSPVRAIPAWQVPNDGLDLAKARRWAREGRKIKIVYRDEHGRRTTRTIWPVTVGYFDAVRVLVAWCELRGDFRSFRADRVVLADFLDDHYPVRPIALRTQWARQIAR